MANVVVIGGELYRAKGASCSMCFRARKGSHSQKSGCDTRSEEGEWEGSDRALRLDGVA